MLELVQLNGTGILQRAYIILVRLIFQLQQMELTGVVTMSGITSLLLEAMLSLCPVAGMWIFILMDKGVGWNHLL